MSTATRGATPGEDSCWHVEGYCSMFCACAAPSDGRGRFGLLLEDLDALAGNVAFAHCDDGDPDTPPPLLVTASVDRLVLRQRLTMANIMTLRGRTM